MTAFGHTRHPLDGWAGGMAELLPLVRRMADLDPQALIRIRAGTDRLSAYGRLPFAVLVGRTLEVQTAAGLPADTTLGAADLCRWLDGGDVLPPTRDPQWRGGLPPTDGWRRIERVPDDVVRGLVRTGALTLKAAGRHIPAGVADGLLDSVVLTAETVPFTLRQLSAVTRMGFLPRGSAIALDVNGRWARIAAPFGSVYTEPGDLGLL